MVFCKISVINLEENIHFVWCAFYYNFLYITEEHIVQ